MPWNSTPSYQSITLLRRHGRECCGLETRKYRLVVERRMVQLIDLERYKTPDRAAPPVRHAAE